jgi:hypothetical protein
MPLSKHPDNCIFREDQQATFKHGSIGGQPFCFTFYRNDSIREACLEIAYPHEGVKAVRSIWQRNRIMEVYVCMDDNAAERNADYTLIFQRKEK